MMAEWSMAVDCKSMEILLIGSNPIHPMKILIKKNVCLPRRCSSMVEPWNHNSSVGGSSPSIVKFLFIKGNYSSVVECLIVAQKVMGSIPINYPVLSKIFLQKGRMAEWSIALVLKTSFSGVRIPLLPFSSI